MEEIRRTVHFKIDIKCAGAAGDDHCAVRRQIARQGNDIGIITVCEKEARFIHVYGSFRIRQLKKKTNLSVDLFGGYAIGSVGEERADPAADAAAENCIAVFRYAFSACFAFIQDGIRISAAVIYKILFK